MNEGRSTIMHNVRVPMRDGTVLRADIYLPESRSPFPVLLTRTPYNKAQSKAIPSYQRLTKAGYVVVVQDIRGRYASEGEFHPLFNPDWTDAEDGYDTVEWVASQSWSNGRVCTFGYSYSAWTQWAMAPTMPPHLVAMFTGGMAPRTTDWEQGGVFRPGRALPWLLGLMAPDTQKYLTEPRGPTTVEAYDHMDENVNRQKWLWFLPWKDLPLEAVGGLQERFHDWLANHHVDVWGFDRDFVKIDLPVFHRTGWYDRLNRTAKMFQGMTGHGATQRARQGQRLVIGPWTHAKDPPRDAGDMDFGPDSETDYVAQLIDWADYWLKGLENGTAETAPVRLFVMGANEWRDEGEWPLARAEPTVFYLHSAGNANGPTGDGRLVLTPSADEPSDTFTYDPRDPVMTLYSLNGHDEPRDLRPLDHRRDVLVYQTEPLERGIEVTGYPSVTLYASSSALDTDFTAKLVDVHPDGFAQSLCYGIVRARFREGFDKPQLMVSGRTHRFDIELLPTSNLFKPGHRIRIDISSSDFPNFDRNHNTGRDDWADPELIVAHQAIYHDAVRPSHVTLPVIPLN